MADNVEMQGLEFQIVNDSASANAGIEQLISTLNRLKSATTGGAAGLKQTANGLQRITNSIKQSKGFNRLFSMAALYKAGNLLSKVVNESNKYQEDLNLFSASMGKYAEEAKKYAEEVSEMMGIDPAEWMRNQGVFNTLLTGFGAASDRAALMSKNLTQLGYDLSSFYNMPVENAMQKVQSGVAGELEPLRRLGYDLSVARLEQERLSLGIDKSVSAMTQAEKAELRYYAIMTQVTVAQGDMARTLEAPANQLRILQAQVTQAARAIGNIFIPILTKVLPYLIAAAQLVREFADTLASLFHFKLTDIDYSNVGFGLSNAAAGAGNLSDNLGKAANAAKKLKQYTMGFDELNIFSPDTESGKTGGTGVAGSSGGFDFALPEYDFIGEAVNKQVKDVKEKLKDILKLVIEIGAGFLAWKLSKHFLNRLEALSVAAGVTLLIDSIRCVLEEGLNLKNTLLAALGGALIGAGIGWHLGGIAGAAAGITIGIGISLIIVGITSMFSEGISLKNVLVTALGAAFAGGAIGFMLGGVGGALAGITLGVSLTLLITGITSTVKDGANIGGIASIISGALGSIGAIAAVFKLFGNRNKNSPIEIEEAGETARRIGDNTSEALVKLKGIAQKLAWGIVIITEISAAAIIFTGTIWILGEELKRVADAWKPVIENAGTVAIAIGVGTGLLVAIGLVTYGLGMVGGTVALNVAIGTAILLELGIATGLFLVEIWAIGKGLDEIGKAWEPVLNNGNNIATAILIGTGLLVAIGAVAAALGVATISTGALLPIAIAIGAAVLAELALNCIAFVRELSNVGRELSDNLAPVLMKLNAKLPKLKSDMSNFVDYMSEFANEVGSYTTSMGKVTWNNLVNSFQKLFSGNPIGSLAKDIDGIYTDTSNLNGKLKLANSELTLAVQMMRQYVTLMSELQMLTQTGNDASSLSLNMFTNLKTVGEQLVTGFTTGINNKLPALRSKVLELKNTIEGSFSTSATNVTNKWDVAMSRMTLAFNTFKINLNNGLNVFNTNFAHNWEQMWRGIGNIFVAQWNSVIKVTQHAMNAVIRAVNQVIQSINAVSGITGISLSYLKSITLDTIRYMAEGGFVDKGQLFIAREAGAEMIGAMGRRTAVANNDQIVEGISTGVSIANDGVIAAIYALIAAVEDKEFDVQIGDNAIGQSYDRYKQKRGRKVSSGVFANAY